MGPGSLSLGALAGVLTILSPCVLPLVPIVVASAASAHRFGPLALAGGLSLSFVTFGLFIATIGRHTGLDSESLRMVGGVILLLLGAVLMSSTLQHRFALAGAGIGSMADGFMQKITPEGWSGQLLLGLILGVVWIPCVGPTLGAASILAWQGENLGQVAIVMTLFGLGAAAPLLLIGTLSREALIRWRGKISSAGHVGKMIFGVLVIVVGLGTVTGVDRALEAWLVQNSPAWMTYWSTRF